MIEERSYHDIVAENAAIKAKLRPSLDICALPAPDLANRLRRLADVIEGTNDSDSMWTGRLVLAARSAPALRALIAEGE